MTQVAIPYTRPATDGTLRVLDAWARVPDQPDPAVRAARIERAAALLREQDAVLVDPHTIDALDRVAGFLARVTAPDVAETRSSAMVQTVGA